MTGYQLVRRWVDGRGVMRFAEICCRLGGHCCVGLLSQHCVRAVEFRINFHRWWSIRTIHPNRPVKFAEIEIAAGPARCGRPRITPLPHPPQPPEVVVTADREPEPISRTGSSISVVKGETLATSNPGSLVDALRTVPGLDISESGGPGSTTNIRLRGANTGQTLVMIDGIRINDPTAASGDFDFAMFAPSAIERIEVLKGPQSALYGSDAMGGVVNIITKKGSGPAQFNVRTEGGSYGTAVTNGSVTGSSGPWSYAVTGGGQHSNGFSRYGYRIPPLEAKFGPLERDGFDRVGGSARFGYDAGEGVRLETGMLSSFTRSAYDQSTGTFPDTPSSATGCWTRSGDAPRSIRSAASSPTASTYSTRISIVRSTM